MAMLKPFTIGTIPINPALTLAPMSQVSTSAFRLICKEIGGLGLVCTELLSSHAIQYRNQRTKDLLNCIMEWSAGERPLAVQLFGNDPQIMAEAAQIVQDMGAEMVDINMGCWVPKVAGKGAGAALLRDVNTATAVVKAIVGAVTIPVTVKVRAGFEMGVVTAVDFARAAEDCGVKMIAVHGRFAAQGFKGQADWDVIRRVKETVTIPVLGNGDVNTPEDAERMLRETGVDGVMIGRAAMGNPWIFSQILHYLNTGQHLPHPTEEQRILTAIRHAHLSVETSPFDETKVCLQLRSQLQPYLHGMKARKWAFAELVRVTNLQQIEAILWETLERNGQPSNLLTV